VYARTFHTIKKEKMKIVVPIIISFFLIASCSIKKKNFEIGKSDTINIQNLSEEYFISDYNLIPVVKNKFTGRDSFQIVNWLNGKTKESGKFAFNSQEDITLLKVGSFKENFENGNLKASGIYEIGKYTQCCAGGLCSQFYNYKLGEWNYYHENGDLKTKVNYKVKSFPIETSCEGGDTISFGQIDLTSLQNLNEEGKQIEISDEYLRKLETVVFNQEEFNSEAIFLENDKAVLDLIYEEK
jgi:hypothetical protein